MQIVRVEEGNFLYQSATIMRDDVAVLSEYGDALIREAAANRMSVSGALQLHYRINQRMSLPVEVHLALPVASFVDDYDGLFHLKRTDAFFCIADVIHASPGLFADRWRKLERAVSILHLERGWGYREILASTEGERYSGFRILQLEVCFSGHQHWSLSTSSLTSK